MNNVLDISITELSNLYKGRKISPVEFLEETFKRLESREDQLKAFIDVYKDEALNHARSVESMISKESHILTGIPYALKDLYAIAGRKLTCGSPSMKNYIAEKNSEVYKQFLSFNSILLGKTNMNEFAAGLVNEKFGRTNNPVDIAYSAGGSSGGSAASVADYIGLFSFGSDTGGSVRIPASYCGILGFKPTQNLSLNKGVFPLSQTLDHVGFFTRHIDDMIIVNSSLKGIKFNSLKQLNGKNKYNLRIGILGDELLKSIDHEVAKKYTQAINLLSDYELLEIDYFEEEKVLDIFANIFYPEMSYIHSQLDNDKKLYRSETYKMVEEGLTYSAQRYIKGLSDREVMNEKVDSYFKGGLDLLLTPTVAFRVPLDEEDESFDLNGETRFTLPFNISGNPALSFNMGYDHENMPIGLQLVGEKFKDEQFLEYAKEIIEKINL